MAKMSDFESAFAAARKEKGAGKTFTYEGKSYTIDYAGEKGPKKKPVTPAVQRFEYGRMAKSMKAAGIKNLAGDKMAKGGKVAKGSKVGKK